MWHICCRQCWLLQLARTGKLAEGSSGAQGPSTVQALYRSKLGTSASAPEVSHWWSKPCEFQCSSLNFVSWEPLYCKENVYLIMSEKECLSHLQQFEKKDLVWPFCCTEKWGTGREGGRIPTLSSSAVATRVQPGIAVPTQMLQPEPGLGHIKCWPTAEFFPVSRALCDYKAFHEWGKRPKLCIAGSEAVWESWVELGWDLTGI